MGQPTAPLTTSLSRREQGAKQPSGSRWWILSQVGSGTFGATPKRRKKMKKKLPRTHATSLCSHFLARSLARWMDGLPWSPHCCHRAAWDRREGGKTEKEREWKKKDQSILWGRNGWRRHVVSASDDGMREEKRRKRDKTVTTNPIADLGPGTVKMTLVGCSVRWQSYLMGAGFRSNKCQFWGRRLGGGGHRESSEDHIS